MFTIKHKSTFNWICIFTILVLIALLLPTNSVLAKRPAQTIDQFSRQTPINGFQSKELTAITDISPTSTSYTNISPTSTTGNLIQDPSFESSYGSFAYWSQYSYQFSTPVCTVAGCGIGNGTAGPRSGSVWVWLGGVPSPYDEDAGVLSICHHSYLHIQCQASILSLDRRC